MYQWRVEGFIWLQLKNVVYSFGEVMPGGAWSIHSQEAEVGEWGHLVGSVSQVPECSLCPVHI